MRLKARLRALYFELAYSLISENHVFDTLEAIATVLEFFQIAAFIFAPRYPWGVAEIQKSLQFVLLAFYNKTLTMFFVSVVLLMNLTFAWLVWEIARKGGISQFRVLQIARLLIGVLSSFLFLPIFEEAVATAYDYITVGKGDLVSVLVITIVNAIGMLAPTIAVAYMQGPDLHRLTVFSRASSRQQVVLLAVKFAISLAFGVLPNNLFPVILLICQLSVWVMALYLPLYFSPVFNLVWMCQHAALTYANIILLILTRDSTDTTLQLGGFPQWFAVALAGALPAAALSGYAYILRNRSVLAHFPIWEHEREVIRAHLRRLVTPRSKLKAATVSEEHLRIASQLVAAAKAVSPADLVRRCRNPSEIVYVSNILFFTGGRELFPYTVEFLARGVKRYPENERLNLAFIAKAAVAGESTAQQKLYIQGLMRKALARAPSGMDTRFNYYAIIKAFEITAFRQQSREMRRMALLDITRFHYNWTAASQAYVAALKWSYQFWRTCSSERVNAEVLGLIADKLQENQDDALHHYHVLLERFPSSVEILRSYASFVLDCLNHPKLGEEIIEFADRLEEEKSDRRQAKSAAAAAHPATSSSQKIQSSSNALDEAKSERSSRQHSASGRSSDLMKAISNNSIFDIESFDSRRNAVAMGTLRTLQAWVRWSYAALFIVIIVIYAIGGQYARQEEALRNLIVNAGTLRRNSIVVINWARNLDLYLAMGAPATMIADAQSRLKTMATAVRSGLSSVFFGVGPAISDYMVTYWTWRTIPDRTFRSLIDYITPFQLFSSAYLHANTLSQDNATTLKRDHPSLQWMLMNGMPARYFDEVISMVSEFQKRYLEAVSGWTSSMEISSIVVGLVPLLIFLLIVLPRWFHLSQELDATTRLFGRIPRKVASVLAQEMRERYEAKLESEGILDQGGARLHSSGGGGGGGDGTGSNSNVAGDRDQTSVMLSLGRGRSKRTLGVRVLIAYTVSLATILLVMIAMVISLSMPFHLFKTRAALANFSGLRFSSAYRASMDLREYVILNQVNASTTRQEELLRGQRSYWRANARRYLDLLNSVHRGVLYGDEARGLSRTLGTMPMADAITFTPKCADLSNLECMSFDGIVTYYSDRVSRILNTTSTITESDIADIILITDPDWRFSTMTTDLRAIYSVANEQEINLATSLSRWLFVGVFPLYIGVYIYLRHVYSLVRSQIKRTRNILFQLPEETLGVSPIIRNYLQTGVIDKDDETKVAAASNLAALVKDASTSEPNLLSIIAAARRQSGAGSDGGAHAGGSGSGSGPHRRSIASNSNNARVSFQLAGEHPVSSDDDEQAVVAKSAHLLGELLGSDNDFVHDPSAVEPEEDSETSEAEFRMGSREQLHAEEVDEGRTFREAAAREHAAADITGHAAPHRASDAHQHHHHHAKRDGDADSIGSGHSHQFSMGGSEEGAGGEEKHIDTLPRSSARDESVISSFNARMIAYLEGIEPYAGMDPETAESPDDRDG
ncbi:hypothetical protein H9P43_002125 [Blastocladiella emersonii ATCC 22665]|nr:hypothetical protein H9P43_002125 [Blastocladiella emersonii ATCC 22665]